jgi:PAS domain S-box-containing protein
MTKKLNVVPGEVEAARLRQQAEKRHHQGGVQGFFPQTEADAQRLVHELQVHQIELEMQNEELREARAEIEAGLERYTNLYEFAPVGYFTLARDGTIRQTNLRGANLLGMERSRLIGARFDLFITDIDHPTFNTFIKKVFESQAKETCEVALGTENGRSVPALFFSSRFFRGIDQSTVQIEAMVTEDGQTCRAIVSDISERKQIEAQREAERDLLQICHFASHTQQLMHDAMLYFKRFTGCEAVGIRLHKGDDFPYYLTSGFSDQFVKIESSLCARDFQDNLQRDFSGNPILECMCGNILCGRFDPSKPFFTPHGSFWTSSTSDLLASTTEAGRQSHTRNRCNSAGYESVALLPMRSQGKTFGLFQFNDSHRGYFDLKRIEILENMVDYIALSLANLETAQSLHESEERYRSFIENSHDIIYSMNTDGIMTYASPNWTAILGHAIPEVTGSSFEAFIHPDDIPDCYAAIEQILFHNQKVAVIDYRARHKDGSWRWLSSNISPIYAVDRHVLYLVGISRDVTEHKISEEALRESEERLRVTLEATQIAIWDWDLKNDKWYTSPQYYTMLGYEPENGESDRNIWLNRVHPQDRNIVADKIKKVLQSQDINYEYEARMLHADGSYRWHRVIGHNIERDPHNLVTRMVGIRMDITERKQAEEALHARENMLNRIFDILPIGLWLTDKSGNLIRSNQAGRKIWGIEAPAGTQAYGIFQARRLPSGEEIAPEDLALAHTINEGVTILDELLEIDARDGQKKAILNYTTPVFDDHGQVEAAIIANLDVSERIQIEDTLMFLAQHGWLGTEENFFESLARFLAEKTKMDYVCIDRLEGDGHMAQTVAIYFDGHFEDNQTYALKDTPCSNVVGKTICCFPTQVRFLFPNDLVLQEMAAESYIGTTLWSATGQPIGLIAIIGRKPLANSQLAETILKLVAVRAANELERQQKETEILEEKALLEQKVAERTADLRLANVELLRSAHMKDEFLASMSHELRTPLTGILGLSEALQLNIYGEMNQKQLDSVHNIEKSGKHLLSLINDILDLSKIDAGMIELDPKTVSIRGVCQSSIQMIRQVSHDKQITVNLNIDEGVDCIEADERRLKQVLVNLLSNAVKFSSTGSEIGLEVKGDIDNRRIIFTVWDHGIGISSQDINRLFHPFTQLDSALSRQYTGTGLGLSLVLKMVELFGGGVTVESEPGKGSRFIVTLPWQIKPTPGTNEIPAPTTNPAKIKSNISESLILIVEDNPLYLSLLTDILTHSGYRVVTAMNGEEGIIQAREQKPHLILMDIQMPVLDGFQAARRIRSDPNPHINKIPIIALTALAMSGDREKCFEAGMNDYLSKPVNIEELKKGIDLLISQN